MIQSKIETPITLTSNSSPVAFQRDCVRTNSALNCNECGWLCHNEGNPLYKIRKGGRYNVRLNMNVSSATAGVVAFGIYLDNVLLSTSATAVEDVTANGYVNLSIDKEITICNEGTLTIQAISTVVTPSDPTTPITTVANPIIASANLQIRKEF